jgi:biotin carboxyl carrier protein
MKMENDIYAPCDGSVSFAVKQGDTVETGAVLAVIK